MFQNVIRPNGGGELRAVGWCICRARSGFAKRALLISFLCMPSGQHREHSGTIILADFEGLGR